MCWNVPQILAEDNLITLDDLPEALQALPNPPTDAGPLDLGELERRTRARPLHRPKATRPTPRKSLGISRRALYRLIEKYGLEKT